MAMRAQASETSTDRALWRLSPWMGRRRRPSPHPTRRRCSTSCCAGAPNGSFSGSARINVPAYYARVPSGPPFTDIRLNRHG
ncbi:unnamed protein product [Merluccius merluccius]